MGLIRGSIVRLAAVGVSLAEGQALRALPAEALDRAAALCFRAITVRLEAGMLAQVLRALEASRHGETLERALVRAEASRTMMQALYGTTSREFTALRRALGLHSGGGRPPALDEASEHALYHAVSRRLREHGEITAELYLELHRETGIPVRAIWRHVLERTSSARR